MAWISGYIINNFDVDVVFFPGAFVVTALI